MFIRVCYLETALSLSSNGSRLAVRTGANGNFVKVYCQNEGTQQQWVDTTVRSPILGGTSLGYSVAMEGSSSSTGMRLITGAPEVTNGQGAAFLFGFGNDGSDVWT